MEYTKAYFDDCPDRRGTGSTKWDGCNEKFGVDANVEMIPMWIADMDFRSPQEVSDAIIRRAQLGLYGYTRREDSFYEAAIQWVDRHYHWQIRKEWIVFSPGVIPGFNIAIQTLTEPGDGVIVQTPVYYPFMEAADRNGRTLVNNPLLEKENGWFIDFEDLEKKARDPKNKMLIFCSPHNPVGRVWSVEELRRLARICAENHVIVISDELHSDLLMKDVVCHAMNEAAGEYRDNTITYYAPSKTFNLAGLQTSFAVIPDEAMRKTYEKGLNANRIFNANCFGTVAMETAFTQCDGYVEALCRYIDANMDYMAQFLRERLPVLKMRKPEATYMTWVDFRRTGMTTEEIEHFIVHEAHIGVDFGSWFGSGGEGYLRFNLACSRSTLTKALQQLETALANRLGER